MAQSKSSSRWLKGHMRDPFVQQAQEQGLRSRAAFKLEEIQRRDHILHPGMIVVDLGAAPGGWSQLARRCVGAQGRVIALDLLPMEALAGVEFIQGDFREDETLQGLRAYVGVDGVDLVISDMAPNISGIRVVDQPRAMLLAELALDLAHEELKEGGDLLVKVFQGSGFQEFQQTLRESFRRVVVRKPKASRPKSREVYFLARGYNM